MNTAYAEVTGADWWQCQFDKQRLGRLAALCRGEFASGQCRTPVKYLDHGNARTSLIIRAIL